MASASNSTPTIEFEDRRFTSHLHLRKGDKSNFVLTWFPSYRDVPRRVDPQLALEQTLDYWRQWLKEVDHDGPYRAIVLRSLITLKALIHRQTGGIVAAPTSSLPESARGIAQLGLSLLLVARCYLHPNGAGAVRALRRGEGVDRLAAACGRRRSDRRAAVLFGGRRSSLARMGSELVGRTSTAPGPCASAIAPKASFSSTSTAK